MSKQYSQNLFAGASGSADITPPFIETTFLERWTGSLVLTVSAATLQGALRFWGSDMPSAIGQLSAADQAVMNAAGFLTATSALSAGITLATGAFTFNNPAIATYAIHFTFAAPLPLALRPEYDFTSGGGTVAIALNLNAYGLNT
jgi:hypothetical protein